MFQKQAFMAGVGINYRSEIANDIIHHLDEIDFVEISTERFFVENNMLTELINSIPIVLHGLTLSIGTDDKSVNPVYLDNLSKALSRVDCLWFSEHIAVTNVNDIEIRALMPTSFNENTIDRIVKKSKQITSLTQKTFLLENITYYYDMPMNEMSEGRFIKEIVERADCGLLLDINNLYVNSINHQYDPYEFLNELPLDRVVEVHLAGCDYLHNMLIDTHASAIRKEVLSLFKHVCQRTAVNGVVIERDAKLEKLSDLIPEVKIVREILKKYRG